MNFGSPLQFLWLILFFLVVFFAWRGGKIQNAVLVRLLELNVLEKMFAYQRWRRMSLRKISLTLLGTFFLILSLAEPQIGQRLQQIKTKTSNIFILLDCSDSMLAEDFKPNRMEKSKRVLSAILEKLAGQRVGIIAFAGEPYVYCPLTFDSSAVKQFLKAIEPGIIPQPGTRIGSALRLALAKLPAGGLSNVVVLLSDGEDHSSDPLGAAEECRKMGVKIFAIGIGNPEGEPIPVRDSTGKIVGYRKNKKGDVILSRLGESDLTQMALLTGGSYFRASESEQEIDILTEKLAQLEKEPSLLRKNIYENRYQWFLAIGMFCLLLAESTFFLYSSASEEKKLEIAL